MINWLFNPQPFPPITPLMCASITVVLLVICIYRGIAIAKLKHAASSVLRHNDLTPRVNMGGMSEGLYKIIQQIAKRIANQEYFTVSLDVYYPVDKDESWSHVPIRYRMYCDMHEAINDWRMLRDTELGKKSRVKFRIQHITSGQVPCIVESMDPGELLEELHTNNSLIRALKFDLNKIT